MSVANVKRIPWGVAVVGTMLLIAGIAVMAFPSIESAVPLADGLTGLVAVVALGLGLWRARVRYSSGTNHAGMPVPELPFALPTPGDDLDEMVYRYVHRGEKTIEYPERIGERLREVAIQVIAHREECTREEAVDALEDGSWTDNRTAAAYFSPEVHDEEPSIGERLSGLLGRGDRTDAYERRIEETVDAIVEAAELVEESGDEPESTDEEPDGLLDRLRGRREDAPIGRDRTSVLEYGDAEGEGPIRYGDIVPTGRWLGVESFALVAVGAGILAVRPALVLAGAVAVAYAAYARFGDSPSPAGLSVERTTDASNPVPGEEVTVTLTVRNDGDALLPDLRLVDLVPPNMTVVEGSPRRYTALRPGEEVTVRYTVVAERGTHEWPLLAVVSGFAGSVEREVVLDVGEPLECLPRLRTVTEVPVRAQTTVYEGQVETDMGGSGLEFHSVREHQPNDPMRRIEWKRLARTGELATVDLREERAATVVLLFDAREGAYVSHSPGSRHALDRSVDAGTEVYASLADKGDLVGVAAFDTVSCWLGPGAGTGHHEKARRLFANHPALASLPPELQDIEGGYVDPMKHVRRQLPSGAQIMLFSSMVSDYVVEVARQLDSAGHRVTVISPNPTAEATPGQRLARVERATRINRLRERGLRVVDWGPDEPLTLTFNRARKRWHA